MKARAPAFAAPDSRWTPPARRAPPTICATRGSSASRRSCSPWCGWGYDENQALGLSGAQAAVPIWTPFMTRALAGHGDQAFTVPPNVTFADIDRDSGQAMAPGCPRVMRESFVAGTEPTQICELHRY